MMVRCRLSLFLLVIVVVLVDVVALSILLMLLLLRVLRYCRFDFWFVCLPFRVSRGRDKDEAKATGRSISDQNALSWYSRPNRTHAGWGLSGTKQVKKLSNYRSFAYRLLLLPLQSPSTINSSGLNSLDQSTTNTFSPYKIIY